MNAPRRRPHPWTRCRPPHEVSRLHRGFRDEIGSPDGDPHRRPREVSRLRRGFRDEIGSPRAGAGPRSEVRA
jgi:hypothetical protein